MAPAPPEAARDTLFAGPRRWVRRHERRVIAAWLALIVVTTGALAVWGVALNGAERQVERLQERWIERLDEAWALLSEHQPGRALPRFEALVAESPAVFVKHRLDREHERALSGLAACYQALDKKARTLETLERLVAFDPRNYANHLAQARALEHFGETGAALEAYRETLRIHPTHLPAVEALIGLHADAARHAEVVAVYEAYLDAYLLARMGLGLDSQTVTFEVPADGRVQRVELPLPLPLPGSGNSGPFLLTHGYSIELISLRLEPPLRVGDPDVPPPALWMPEAGATHLLGLVPTDAALSAREPETRAEFSVARRGAGSARAVLELRVFKMLPEELWATVQAAYRNTLAGEALERARARSLVGGVLSAGSTW